MTQTTTTTPEDLIPLDNASLRDPLMQEMKETHRDVTALHPLLDLVEPMNTPEMDLIERLIDLLTQTSEELRLSCEARISTQQETDTLRRQVAEMHALLISPVTKP
ncbi:hypothetical protein EU805_16880 [Salipiger sp. IMCC34102]|uniref:hypothetical protein n=1 Tax=Salipiger sp. IMCC34102 TaxID=2510647 RepID=UPI00101C558A|nr:hypothetical protein [Salipiger sp. IMCC34102]RYH00727.1 hypothetical protein EU805_16880 [Salipiger sp. IMCC34102]